ncbi:hypothetical protein AAG570_006068 [Ranatra chinensis]|uniref:Major facilitator superfamily associated domain-containing protein n=1 Tax=Ranatra chinensis TaxID=642074 RepID=A0ABD0XX97_9HEMI
MRMADSEKPVKIGPSRFELYCEKLDINPNLVMLKLTLFVMYGATASLLPFLTIHMQSIGLTVEEIAIVYLALPLTTFLSPPITGFLVDRFGHYKVWWSPCPSRECPEDEELNLVLDQCDDHCLLRNSSSKPPGLLKGIHQSIAVRPPTRVGCHGGYQGRPPSETPNWGILPEDLHFHLEKKKTSNHSTTGYMTIQIHNY